MIKILKCLHCGSEWVSRMDHLPKCCGKCHCQNWDRPLVERSRIVKIKPPEKKHPLNDLPIGGKYLYKWIIDRTGYPDEKAHMLINHSIGRHAKRHGRKYLKENTGLGILVIRIA